MASTGMTESELVSLVNGQIDDAKAYDRNALQGDRDKALQFVNGEVDIVAEDGKSSVVSRDLADVLDWVIPSLDRIFLASDKVATYEPKKPEMVEGPPDPETGQPSQVDASQQRASQATDYMNAVFLGDCSGYAVLHAGFYDSLLHGNGIIKHWWDPSKEYTTETFRGLSDAAYTQLVSDPEVEKVLEHTEYPDPAFGDGNLLPTVPSDLGGSPRTGAPTAREDGINASSRGAVGYDGLKFLRSPDGVTNHRPQHVASDGEPPPGIGTDPFALDAVPNHGNDHVAAADARKAESGLARMGSGSAALDELLGAPPAPDPFPTGMDGPDPLGGPVAPVAPMLHDCKIKRCVSTGRLRVEVVPGEEFLIPNTRVLDETIIGCGHQYRLTRSELIKRGYDRLKVEDAPVGTEAGQDSAAFNREGVFVGEGTGAATKDKSTELVDVYEWYPLVDYDGDGVAERRKVVMLGLPSKRTMVENVEWGDDHPFTDLKVHPIPHRWKGRSLFDVMYDIQRNKTVLLRQTNDNLYMTNNPMSEVVENQVINMDVLINREIGGNVFVRQAGAIRQLDVQFTAAASFQMLAYWDEVQERRTGVSKSSQVLDMDKLTNQTAAAVHEKQAAGAIKPEFYARNLKEMGLKRLFQCLLRLIVKNQDRPRTIRIKGQWVEFDPRGWDAEYDTSINTGLGSGSRDRDLQYLMAIKQEQQAILMSGHPAASVLVPIDKYRNTLAKMVETAGLRDPDQFYGEVTAETVQKLEAQQGQQPDPKALEAQAKIQADQAKFQAEMQMKGQQLQAELQMRQAEAEAEGRQRAQSAQLDATLRAEEARLKAQFEREKAAAELQLARDRAAAEMEALRERAAAEVQLLRERANAEIEMKRQELTFEFELKRMQMSMGQQGPAATNIPEVTQ